MNLRINNHFVFIPNIEKLLRKRRKLQYKERVILLISLYQTYQINVHRFWFIPGEITSKIEENSFKKHVKRAALCVGQTSTHRVTL